MRISLIVCTHNRANRLSPFFDAINALTCDEAFEVIIVDNNSTDHTAQLLAEFARSAVVPVSILSEPTTGVARARNTGFKRARGEILAFTDDDCYPDPRHLQRVLECFDEQPSLGFLGGRVLLFDPTDYRITIQECEERGEIAPRQFIVPGLIHGANFAFRRTAFEAVGGFDHALGPGTPFICEDTDMLARVCDAGWPGAYDPRPLVYHHHRRKTEAEAMRLHEGYARGRGAYYIKSVLHLSERWRYLKHWYWNLRYLRWSTIRRELASALRYLATQGVVSSSRGSL